MAGGSTNSREQNFWPGFVDALTNVVLVMVFVVVVFAIALFASVAKITKTYVDRQVTDRLHGEMKSIAERTEQAIQAADAQRARADELQAQNASLSAALQVANEMASRVASSTCVGGNASATRQQPSEVPPVSISGRYPSITVTYGSGVTKLEKKLLEALDEAIAGYEGAPEWEVSLRARTSELSPSEAQRLAFYRISVLRDYLVSRGVRPERIETVILPEVNRGGRSTVTLQLKKAS